jgi:alpha-methylacyl-CoA racemase
MGPLQGLRVLEFAGLGAAPFCAMLLADMGADVIRLDRADQRGKGTRFDILNRGRRSVAFDLKNKQAIAATLRLVETADILLEGFRPGVTERLGLGPQECLSRNPRLVYGRMTGWGQSGTLAQTAGHDINYIALSGALDAIGPAARPTPPLNLVGDYGGGMLMAFGLVCAVLEARQSGKGQVVDGAMLDAAALTMNRFLGLWAEGRWTLSRHSNYLDGGAPFYDTYECADGRWISIGPIEPQFYALLLSKLDARDLDPSRQNEKSSWPEQKEKLAALFRSKPQAAWCELLEGTDVCFAPVLSLAEVADHPHNKSRDTFVEIGGVVQAAPAPRFSRTACAVGLPPPAAGEHDREALTRWGFSGDDIDALRRAGAFGASPPVS